MPDPTVNSPSKADSRRRRALAYRTEYDAGASISELMLAHHAGYNTVYALLELAGTMFRTDRPSPASSMAKTARSTSWP